MAATAWRACLPMNTVRAKLCSCPLCLKAKESKLRCWNRSAVLPEAGRKRFCKLRPTRVEPHCPYFRRCGGCHYQHTSYEHQLEIKAAILKENLRRIAKLELEADDNDSSLAALELPQPYPAESPDRLQSSRSATTNSTRTNCFRSSSVRSVHR